MSTFLKIFLVEKQVDFICLQETIKCDYSNFFLRKFDPANLFLWNWIPSRGRAGGMLCGIRQENLNVISIQTGILPPFFNN
uniref:Endonuclease/exonuclease/phosphatase domain-containing protein n=1 Tax=Arundo donax TaxID=35708 RepID=A0A0A9HMI6_ARUDO